MTKQEEIELLEKMAVKLGVDSYSGRWFRGILPIIADHIKSDFLVDDLDPLIIRNQCREMKEKAQKEADSIIATAKNNSEFILAEARQRAELIRAQLRHSFNKCEEMLGL